MAHLRPIDILCQRCRRATAKAELFNNVNAPLGRYCMPCGKQALRELQKLESKNEKENTRWANKKL